MFAVSLFGYLENCILWANESKLKDQLSEPMNQYAVIWYSGVSITLTRSWVVCSWCRAGNSETWKLPQCGIMFRDVGCFKSVWCGRRQALCWHLCTCIYKYTNQIGVLDLALSIISTNTLTRCCQRVILKSALFNWKPKNCPQKLPRAYKR